MTNPKNICRRCASWLKCGAANTNAYVLRLQLHGLRTCGIRVAWLLDLVCIPTKAFIFLKLLVAEKPEALGFSVEKLRRLDFEAPTRPSQLIIVAAE